MSLRFSSLGSGSEGNCLVVESVTATATTRVLVDCGFGKRELESRLALAGLTTKDIDAVLVTHEHGDHIGGVFRAVNAYGWPVFLTYGTLVAVRGGAALAQISKVHELINIINPQITFQFGNFSVQPIAVPHDAREPVQYVLEDSDHRLGVLTDIGHPTAHVLRALHSLDALLIECNHDATMLSQSDYPHSLKRRIAGPYGHLDNEASTQIMAKIDLRRLRLVVGGHLSQSNNTPALAFDAIRRGLEKNVCSQANRSAIAIHIASQASGCEWQALM